MKFVLEFDAGTEPFQVEFATEIDGVLDDVRRRVARGDFAGVIHDSAGATIGEWTFTPREFFRTCEAWAYTYDSDGNAERCGKPAIAGVESDSGGGVYIFCEEHDPRRAA